jgi:hypothetical protein
MDTITTQPTGQKLTTRRVCLRYGVSDRTVARWERDPDLRFPQPLLVNGRKYFDEDELTRWDRANAGRLTAA